MRLKIIIENGRTARVVLAETGERLTGVTALNIQGKAGEFATATIELKNFDLELTGNFERK